MNTVNLVGRLGQKPEIRFTPSGVAVTNLSVATNTVWKDKDGQRQQRTEWHRVTVWGKQAETCGEYLDQGRLVEVSGELRSNKWTDKDNNQRVTVYVHANHVGFLGGGSNQQEKVQAYTEEAAEQEATLVASEVPF